VTTEEQRMIEWGLNPWTFVVLSVVTVVAAMLWGVSCSPAQPRTSAVCNEWEYSVNFALPDPQPDRKNAGAYTGTSITPKKEDLEKLGVEGWELVGTYLETETAYPIFEKNISVNVRPQRLVLLFKRKGTCAPK
jgi:hypothetical protein